MSVMKCSDFFTLSFHEISGLKTKLAIVFTFAVFLIKLFATRGDEIVGGFF